MEFTKVLMVVAVVAVGLAVLNLGVVMFQVGKIKTQGYAASEIGTANLTIEQSVTINFTTRYIEFGSGAIDTGSGCTRATLNTNGSNHCGTSDWVSYSGTGLILENIGGVDANLTLYSDVDAATFLGGTSPRYDWEITDNLAGACDSGSVVPLPTGYNAVTIGNTPSLNVCGNFTFINGQDKLEIDVWLEIPDDTTNVGLRTSTITADAYTGAE